MPTRILPLPADFPALAALGLSGADLAALATQGRLDGEDNGRGARYHKLRFRVGARQHVRFVGNNPAFVAQLREELAQLQADRTSRRESQRMIRAARSCLRRTKRLLAPLLRMAGRQFYGREIRRQAPPRATRVAGDETQK
jgi:hypothetical protein